MPSKKILAQKEKLVNALADELKSAKSVVLSDYQGLTVAQDTEMRKAFREAGLKYHVVKNTYSLRAFESIGITGMDAELKGPTALCFSTKDAVLAPRLVKKYTEQFKKTQIKGGVVDGKCASADLINQLAAIPAVEVLYGQLVTGLIFPVTKLAMTLGAMAKKAEENGFSNVADLASATAQPATAE